MSQKTNIPRLLFSITLIGIFVYLVSPFIMPVILGGILCILIYPFYKVLLKYCKNEWILALITTTFVTFVFLFPLGLLTFSSIKTALEKISNKMILYENNNIWDNPLIHNFLSKISTWFSVDKEILIEQIQSIAKDLTIWFANMFAIFLSKFLLFFFI